MKFKIMTDHKALLGNIKLKEPNKTTIRLLMKLEEFEGTFVHVPGTEMEAPDALSRMGAATTESVFPVQVSNVNGLSVTDLKQIIGRKMLLGKKGDSIRRRFSVIDKEVYLDGQFRVPDERERQQIIAEYHKKVAGHQGFKKTLDTIRRRFYWKGLRQDIWKLVHGCRKCFEFNVATGSNPRLPESCQSSTKVGDILSLDHVDLVPGVGGCSAILVAVDGLSRKGFAWPVRTKGTVETIVKIGKLFEIYGPWKTSVADRGSAFISNEFQTFLERHGSKRRLSTSDHPEGNGVVERLNRTLISMLAKRVSRPGMWPRVLGDVMKSYNQTVHTVRDTPSIRK